VAPLVEAPDLARQSRDFWDRNPLLAFEIPDPGTEAFIRTFDRIRVDLEQHALHLWEFDRHAGHRVLDIGCGGPAFLVRRFLEGGGKVTGLDVSGTSLSVAKAHLQIEDMHGSLCQGSAEELPFPGSWFDFVTSSGVLHHAPDTERALREVFRVLRPGGRTVISLYFRSVFLRPRVWPATRLALSLLLRPVPGRSSFQNVATADDFVRRWDGNENPVGKCYSRREARELFSAFNVERIETHVFHHRLFRIDTRAFARVLDFLAPTMIYVVAGKPQ
jgi:SAM-dependent methyltransferase